MKRFLLGAAYGIALGVVLRGLLDYGEHLARIARPTSGGPGLQRLPAQTTRLSRAPRPYIEIRRLH